MNWLKIKTAGLPRWAWVMLFSGAVITGLYLRHKSEENSEPEETEEEPLYNDSLAGYNGTESAGGLAAAGLIGPAQGQVVPVEAPYLPEGFTEVFGQQSEALQALIGALSEREPGERVEVIRETEPAGSSAPVTAGVTGGGPPKRKPVKRTPPRPKHGGGGGSRPSGGGGGSRPPVRAPNVPAPHPLANHPQAVDTGNACVNGGVGKHTAPPGYHLFCQNGRIYRAPNN